LRQGGDLGEAAASSSGVGVPGVIDILPLEDSNGGIFRLAGILPVFEVVIIGCISEDALLCDKELFCKSKHKSKALRRRTDVRVGQRKSKRYCFSQGEWK